MGFALCFFDLFSYNFSSKCEEEMMRKLRWYLIFPLILLVWLGGDEPSFSKNSLHQFTLDNGLKVILEETRAAPVVALQVWVKVGSADEKDEEAGMCHFIEHMLFKGTEKRKVREGAKEIESLGGTSNAYTSYDQTVYHVTLASRYADIALDILSDAIQHSIFDPVEFEREKEVILEEIRRAQDDPSKRLFRQTVATFYQKHPYRRPVIGFAGTVRSIQRDQMIEFFKKWYVPNRIVLIGVGDFDSGEMEKRIRELFRDFRPSSDRPPERMKEPVPVQVHAVISYSNVKETYLHIAFPAPSAKDEDTPALDVIAHVLGSGEASRLVQKVKLEKRLVHSIYASSYTPRDPGLFFIGATLPAENAVKAIEAILEEVNRLRREGVTAEELHRAKINIESGLIYSRQTVQGQAGKIGNYELTAGDVEFEKEYMRRVALLQNEEIQNVSKKYLKRSQLTLSVLAPEEKAEVFKNHSLTSLLEKPALGKAQAEAKSPPNKTALDNGIRIIVKENRSVPIVTVQVSFLGGLRFEQPSNNGINSFMAVMLTKGSKDQSSFEIARKVERMAGSLSGFSGYNSFGLTFTFLNQHFGEAFKLLTEVIRQPSFDKEEMEKRRRLILASIRQQEDDLGNLVFKLFRKTLYERHPYGMDTLGTIDSVEKITQKDLMENYARFAVPENMVITVVGDVDPKQVVLAVKHAFGDLHGNSFRTPTVLQEPPLQKKRVAELRRQKEQAHFVLGFLGISYDHPDSFALKVLDAALSGQGGRLFRQLRDKESLAYALNFMAQQNLDPGFIGVYMGTHPDKLETAIKAVLRELKKVKEEGLTEGEVARAKKYLIGNFEIGLQTNAAQANQMSLDELYGLGFDHYQKYPREIEKVKKEDVDRVARKYLSLDSYVIAIIRPPQKLGTGSHSF